MVRAERRAMLGTESTMTLNFTHHRSFGIRLGDMTEEVSSNSPSSNLNNAGGMMAGAGNGLSNAQSMSGPGGIGGGGGGITLNGVNGNGSGVATPSTSGQQSLPPATPPPSSWASKVRAGLGSESSPTLTGAPGGSMGAGGVGDLASGEIDSGVVVGEGIQGLPHSLGHLGPLTTGGSMGPVHGLDMNGGMPGRAMPPTPSGSESGGTKSAIGAVGMAVGAARGQDNLQQGQQQGSIHRGPEMLGNGARRGSGVGSGIPVIDGEGSAALAQEFSTLDIGGASLGPSAVGRGSDAQGFDATKDELLGDFPCVRLRGLAGDTSMKDILDFFVGLGPVLDVILEDGPTEEEMGAITLFGNLMDYHGALQRYSLQIKGRYIEVAPAGRSDYYTAVIKRSGREESEVAGLENAGAKKNGSFQGIDGARMGSRTTLGAACSQNMHGKTLGTVVLPSSIGLQGASLGIESGMPTSGHAGAAGVTAPVMVPSPSAPPVQLVTAQSPGVVGSHTAGGAGRKGSVKAGPTGGSSSKSKGISGDGKGAVIRMRGLPYRASKSEVMGFFKGCSIPEEGIAFVTRADGRVTGEAYVRFSTREDAKMGIRKDREMMGSRYIELFTSSPEEMSRYANTKR